MHGCRKQLNDSHRAVTHDESGRVRQLEEGFWDFRALCFLFSSVRSFHAPNTDHFPPRDPVSHDAVESTLCPAPLRVSVCEATESLRYSGVDVSQPITTDPTTHGLRRWQSDVYSTLAHDTMAGRSADFVRISRAGADQSSMVLGPARCLFEGDLPTCVQQILPQTK